MRKYVASAPTSAATLNLRFEEFVWIWNMSQGVETPDLHLQMARWLAQRRHPQNRRLLLLAFRSSGKSTLVGLFAAWLLLRHPATRVLALAADFALAKKMVRNVKRIIERHPFTRHLKPARADQWAADQFTVRRDPELRDPSMLAKGIGANITGLRADVIICDDVEVPNTCDSPQKRLDLRERLRELDYVLMPGGLQVFIGTPHTYHSIYKDEPNAEGDDERPFLENFARLELPLVDEDGKSRWPERFPTSQIEWLQKQSGPNKFLSQMLLRPVNIVDSRLDADLLGRYSDDLDYREGNQESRLYLQGRRLVSASCWWDPAYGSPGTGDGSVVACVFTSEDGHYWLHALRYLNHDPDESGGVDAATQMCSQVAAFVEQYHLPAVTLETNGLGRFLPGLLRSELRKSRSACAVIEHVTTKNKDLRILDAFDAVLAAGMLHAHERVWTTRFPLEMREWRPGVETRDDGLDAVSGCLLSEPVRLPRLPVGRAPSRRLPWRLAGRTHVADAHFLP